MKKERKGMKGRGRNETERMKRYDNNQFWQTYRTPCTILSLNCSTEPA